MAPLGHIVIATEFTRSPQLPALIEQAKATGARVVIVHTVAGAPDVHGCINIRDTTPLHYPHWINTGLAECVTPGPVLVLNDDLKMDAWSMRRMLELGRGADLVTTTRPNGPTTPLSGYCFVMANWRRFDEGYRWWFSDDELWHSVIAENGRVVVADVPVQHERNGSPKYPDGLHEDVMADRKRFADRWRNGVTDGLPPRGTR